MCIDSFRMWLAPVARPRCWYTEPVTAPALLNLWSHIDVLKLLGTKSLFWQSGEPYGRLLRILPLDAQDKIHSITKEAGILKYSYGSTCKSVILLYICFSINALNNNIKATGSIGSRISKWWWTSMIFWGTSQVWCDLNLWVFNMCKDPVAGQSTASTGELKTVLLDHRETDNRETNEVASAEMGDSSPSLPHTLE